MAEGLSRHIHGSVIDVASAGIQKQGLNPLAVKVMGEIGIDISRHQSKTVDDLVDTRFDYVITVCSHADETCPVFPAATRIVHHGFDDPPKLAKSAASEADALVHYRRVRDEIKFFVLSMPGILGGVAHESN